MASSRSCVVCLKRPWLDVLSNDNNDASLLRANIVDDAAERCGHQFCASCVASRFDASQRHFFSCPSCGAPVRQRTLKDGTLEEAEAVRFREKHAKVAKIRNRGAESFASAEEFGAYQEKSADLVHSLVHFVGAEESERALDEYERHHRVEIELNESKKNSRRLEERNLFRQENDLLEGTKRQHRTRDALLGQYPGPNDNASAAEKATIFIDGPQDLVLMQPQPLRCPLPSSRVALAARAPRRALAGGASAAKAQERALRIVLLGLTLVPVS